MENIQVGRETHKNTRNKAAKKILSPFSEECPTCGSTRYAWEFDLPTAEEIRRGKKKPPIREHGMYDLVRYRCQCGSVFKKIENLE